MSTNSFIDIMPLWVFNLIVSAIVLLSLEAGWRLGNYRRQRGEDEKPLVNAAVGATLGLLAFLLAFTLSTDFPLDRAPLASPFGFVEGEAKARRGK